MMDLSLNKSITVDDAFYVNHKDTNSKAFVRREDFEKRIKVEVDRFSPYFPFNADSAKRASAQHATLSNTDDVSANRISSIVTTGEDVGGCFDGQFAVPPPRNSSINSIHSSSASVGQDASSSSVVTTTSVGSFSTVSVDAVPKPPVVLTSTSASVFAEIPSQSSNPASKLSSSLAFMRFKDDLVEALKRLKHLQIREKDLQGKLLISAESLKKSEAEKRTLCSSIEKREEEAKEKTREIERNFIFKLEEHNVRLRKMELETNAAVKRREAVISELESTKHSLRVSSLATESLESKLQDATRLQEFQSKRIETLETENAEYKAVVDTLRQNEKKLNGKIQTLDEHIRHLTADSEAATERERVSKETAEGQDGKLLTLEIELRKCRDSAKEASSRELRDKKMSAERIKDLGDESEKWRKLVEKKDEEIASLHVRLDALFDTVKMQMETKSEVDKSVEEARDACVAMERDLRTAREEANRAQEEAKTGEEELRKLREEMVGRERKAENQNQELETKIQRLKEDVSSAAENLERNNSFIEALKTSLDAKEKVLKRTEERYEVEAKDWKDKEACYEAQLMETQQLRERVDHLSTINYNHRAEAFEGPVSEREGQAKVEVVETGEEEGEQVCRSDQIGRE